MNGKLNPRNFLLLLVGFLALSLLITTGSVAAQEDEVQTQTEAQTIYEIIQAEPELSDFEALVEAVALTDNLNQDGPFTVFAPTNDAWAAFNASNDSDISMTDVLLYHVMNGKYNASDLAQEEAVTTLAGEYLFFANSEQGETTALMINESVPVASADIQASNGVVHIIDTVLSFPEGNTIEASDLGSPDKTIVDVLAEDGRFETLVSLLEQAGLSDALQNSSGNYTLFAPTDEAFASADPELVEEWTSDPEGALNTILSYHVVNDRLTINQIANDDYLPTMEGRAIVVDIDEFVRVYLNGRPVQSFNILADNGIIHVVDEVILP
jgi:transforming growth factor-beta-induced protein